MNPRSEPPSLLGRIDLHVHVAPDAAPRLLGAEEAGREAARERMRAILLKSHRYETVRAAESINADLRRAVAFGAVALNDGLGRASLRRAKDLIARGARVVYLPTSAAANPRRAAGEGGGTELLRRGRLRPEIVDLLHVVAQAGTTLATGHIGRRELDAVLPAAWKARVRTVLVTHPEYAIGYLSQSEQVDIRDAFPNAFFERTCYSILADGGRGARCARRSGNERPAPSRRLAVDEASLEKLLANIHAVGPDRSVLSSDLGQPWNPRPAQGFRQFLELLCRRGVSRQALAWMTVANPRRALDLCEEYLEQVARIEAARLASACRTAYRAPVVGFAAAADPLFAALKTHVGPQHSLPAEILPGARSVLSLFMPFAKSLVDSNRRGRFPSPAWCLAYTETNRLLDQLARRLGETIESMGFAWANHSAAHHLTNNHDPDADALLMTSAWSQRHIAYVAGLGAFGRNQMLITAKGCAGRLSSLVTTMPLTPTARASAESCLSKRGILCEKCVRKCPADALGGARVDSRRCWRHLVAGNEVSRRAGLPIVNVCGKCVSGVPCSLKRP